MKKTIIAFAISITTYTISAQKLKENDVPLEVKEAFKKQYPEVKKAEWEKEGGNYEVEFHLTRVPMDGKGKKKSVEKSVVFNAEGKLIETEEEINVSELPAAINEYVNKNLLGKKIKEASKISDHENKITYEIEIGKEEYLFDSAGTFIKK